MKKSLLIASVLAVASMASFPAHAFLGGTTNNNYDQRDQSTTNAPVANGGHGGHGGQGGQGGQGGNGLGVGVGVGVGIGQGGNANATGGNATGGSATGGAATVGDIRNTNTAAGGSVLGSGNSANTNANDNRSQATASGNTTEVNVAGDNYEAQKRAPVSTAYAPTVMPTAPCMGSTSGGISTVGLSISGGGTWIDENCQLLEQVRAVNNIGERDVAVEMLNAIPAYAEAKKRLADRKSTASGVAYNATPVVVKPELTDPIVRKRLGLPPL